MMFATTCIQCLKQNGKRDTTTESLKGLGSALNSFSPSVFDSQITDAVFPMHSELVELTT